MNTIINQTKFIDYKCTPESVWAAYRKEIVHAAGNNSSVPLQNYSGLMCEFMIVVMGVFATLAQY